MKRILSLMLAAILAGCLALAAAETDEERYEILTAGVETAFSGNFFSAALGNNSSDRDVRALIHQYSPVYWDSAQGMYQFDKRVVSGVMIEENDNGSITYTIAMTRNLRYSDGTPITAADYAFSLLLQSSKELEEAVGYRVNSSTIAGFPAYHSGEAQGMSGIAVNGDSILSVTVAPEYANDFYQLESLNIVPYPMHIIAPGCSIGTQNGMTCIQGPYTADLLRQTMTDPQSGYISHPLVTSGPYMLKSYNGTEAVLEINPLYAGDLDGRMPSIPTIQYRYEEAENAISDVAEGKLDLIVRCVRDSQVTDGMALAASEDFSMSSYARNGLSFISFCAEKGPTSDVNVRQALSMCIDRDTLLTEYTGAFGLKVKGNYGLGQWMYLMCNGTMVPEDEEEAAAWADLNLDGITEYDFNPESARALLQEAGWVLDENGNAYNERGNGIRYKETDGTLVPLELKLIYPDNNEAGPMLQKLFAEPLAKIGGQLTLEAVPFEDLLERYYAHTARDCDMILLGTNFTDVYDPSMEFNENHTHIMTGITDAHAEELAADMRKTEPGAAAEYCRKWVAWQEYRSSIAMDIPLYSNAYFDFYTAILQDYRPAEFASWTEAAVYARLSDTVEEEEVEEELGDDDVLP